jgi:hypothetical protein
MQSPKCSGTKPADHVIFPRVTIKNDGKKKEWKKLIKPTIKEGNIRIYDTH